MDDIYSAESVEESVVIQDSDYKAIKQMVDLAYDKMTDRAKLVVGERLLLESFVLGFKLGRPLELQSQILVALMLRLSANVHDDDIAILRPIFGAIDAVVDIKIPEKQKQQTKHGGLIKECSLALITLKYERSKAPIMYRDLNKPLALSYRLLEYMINASAETFPMASILFVLKYLLQHLPETSCLASDYALSRVFRKFSEKRVEGKTVELSDCGDFYVRHLTFCIKLDAMQGNWPQKQSAAFYEGVKLPAKKEALQTYLSAILARMPKHQVLAALSRVLDNSTNYSKTKQILQPALGESLQRLYWPKAEVENSSISVYIPGEQVLVNEPAYLTVALSHVIHSFPKVFMPQFKGGESSRQTAMLNLWVVYDLAICGVVTPGVVARFIREAAQEVGRYARHEEVDFVVEAFHQSVNDQIKEDRSKPSAGRLASELRTFFEKQSSPAVKKSPRLGRRSDRSGQKQQPSELELFLSRVSQNYRSEVGYAFFRLRFAANYSQRSDRLRDLLYDLLASYGSAIDKTDPEIHKQLLAMYSQSLFEETGFDATEVRFSRMVIDVSKLIGDGVQIEFNYLAVQEEFERIYQGIKDKQLPSGERELLERLRVGFKKAESAEQQYLLFRGLINQTKSNESVIGDAFDRLFGIMTIHFGTLPDQENKETQHDDFYDAHLEFCRRIDKKQLLYPAKQSGEFYRGVDDGAQRDALQAYLSAILSRDSKSEVLLAMASVLDCSTNNSPAMKVLKPAFYKSLIGLRFVAHLLNKDDEYAKDYCLYTRSTDNGEILLALASLLHAHPAIYKLQIGALDRVAHAGKSIIGSQHNIFLGDTLVNMLLGFAAEKRQAKQGRILLRVFYELAAENIVPPAAVIKAISTAHNSIEYRFSKVPFNIGIKVLYSLVKELEVPEQAQNQDEIFASLRDVFATYAKPETKGHAASFTARLRMSRASGERKSSRSRSSSRTVERDILPMAVFAKQNPRLCFALLKLKMATEYSQDPTQLFRLLQSVLIEFGKVIEAVNVEIFQALEEAYNQFAGQHGLSSYAEKIKLQASSTYVELMGGVMSVGSGQGHAEEKNGNTQVRKKSESSSGSDEEGHDPNSGAFYSTGRSF